MSVRFGRLRILAVGAWAVWRRAAVRRNRRLPPPRRPLQRPRPRSSSICPSRLGTGRPSRTASGPMASTEAGTPWTGMAASTSSTASAPRAGRRRRPLGDDSLPTRRPHAPRERADHRRSGRLCVTVGPSQFTRARVSVQPHVDAAVGYRAGHHRHHLRVGRRRRDVCDVERLAVYDIVSETMRLALGGPGAPRPASLDAAAVYVTR